MPGRIPVLVDFDNTMGLARREIDDGLALLMLLASDVVELVGVTTTFGNGSESDVYRCTVDLLGAAGRPDIPVVRGAARSGQYPNDASRFIVDTSLRYPGKLEVLSVGSLSNLAGALATDALVAERVRRVCIMGGYVGPLRFPRRAVSELNLSADPVAAAAVLDSSLAISLMSAQLCLQARYGLRHLLADLVAGPRTRSVILQWFAAFSYRNGTAGFYLWDLLPAWAIIDPARFPRRPVRLLSTEADLCSGSLKFRVVSRASGFKPRDPGIIDLPCRIRSRFHFAGDCARLWRRTRLAGRLRPR